MYSWYWLATIVGLVVVLVEISCDGSFGNCGQNSVCLSLVWVRIDRFACATAQPTSKEEEYHHRRNLKVPVTVMVAVDVCFMQSQKLHEIPRRAARTLSHVDVVDEKTLHSGQNSKGPAENS